MTRRATPMKDQNLAISRQFVNTPSRTRTGDLLRERQAS